MRRLLPFAALAAALALHAFGGGVTNATSDVVVKGWRREYVYGLGGGRIHDPSGKIASWERAAVVKAAAENVGEVADAARSAASNSLRRLYGVTNNVADYSRKMFVQVHLYPDLQSLTNCWGRVVDEWTDGSADHCWVYFSRAFPVAPVMKRRYLGETETNWVEGAWTDWTNGVRTVDGYEGCREIVYARPEAFRDRNCFANPYVNFGTPEGGFDFGSRTFEVDGRLFFTGAWTNAAGKIWWFNNGVKVLEEEDVEQ